MVCRLLVLLPPWIRLASTNFRLTSALPNLLEFAVCQILYWAIYSIRDFSYLQVSSTGFQVSHLLPQHSYIYNFSWPVNLLKKLDPLVRHVLSILAINDALMHSKASTFCILLVIGVIGRALLYYFEFQSARCRRHGLDSGFFFPCKLLTFIRSWFGASRISIVLFIYFFRLRILPCTWCQ